MPEVRRADPAASLVSCHYVTEATLVAGDPAEREHVLLDRPDAGFFVGAWEAQPYTEWIAAYPSDEFCTVVRGRLTLTPEDGEPQTFAAGDSFVIEAGWSGTWQVHEPFLKFFAAVTR